MDHLSYVWEKGCGGQSVLTILTARWFADALIVVGCGIVKIGTTLGGYNLRIYTLGGRNEKGEDRR